MSELMNAQKRSDLKMGIQSPTHDVEQWLHVYEQMTKIREFEEKVNELYMKALMPGLAHLYIG